VTQVNVVFVVKLQINFPLGELHDIFVGDAKISKKLFLNNVKKSTQELES
jgi:hypothetical protein